MALRSCSHHRHADLPAEPDAGTALGRGPQAAGGRAATTEGVEVATHPAIDLVLATVGRTDEPLRLLQSLEAQTFRDFRLVVVDQNEDGRLDSILEDFASAFAIVRMRSELGNSHARNVGLRHVQADVLGFPDDDCWYPPDLLGQVADCLAARPDLDGLSGRSIDEEGRSSGGRWDRRPGRITRFNIWQRACAYTVFLRRSAVERTGLFDETLGLGPRAAWPAGEDLDYVLRSVLRGCVVSYEPKLCVYHAQTRESLADPLPETGYRYGMGVGRVLRKNGLPAWFAGYYVARSFGAAMISLVRRQVPRSRFYWAVGRGRLRGWRSSSTPS